MSFFATYVQFGRAIGSLEAKIPAVEERLKKVESPYALLDIQSQATAAVAEATKTVGELRAHFKANLNGPAAFYHCTARGQPILDGSQDGTIIDFSTKVYNTHANSVNPGGNWKYTAPESGIYCVTALAVFHQETGGTGLGVYVNGGRVVHLAQISPSSGRGTTIGGTALIELNRGTAFDIRIHTFDDTKKNATLDSIGATWVAIHYVRPPSNAAK